MSVVIVVVSISSVNGSKVVDYDVLVSVIFFGGFSLLNDLMII